MQQPNYRIYATLLDAFWGYLNSDVIWDKYWGWSENPPHTPEEFHEQQFQELINCINRKPFDSEAADKGTAFNELVDALIENRKPNGMDVERNKDNTCYTVVYNDRTFVFPISLCREFADYFKGALTQQRVEAILPTVYGNVLVYGLIDELMPTSVHDIKTTGIVEFNKGGYVVDTYTETYVFNPERDIPILTNHCEEFIRFLEENRKLITDTKIFGNE